MKDPVRRTELIANPNEFVTFSLIRSWKRETATAKLCMSLELQAWHTHEDRLVQQQLHVMELMEGPAAEPWLQRLRRR